MHWLVYIRISDLVIIRYYIVIICPTDVIKLCFVLLRILYSALSLYLNLIKAHNSRMSNFSEKQILNGIFPISILYHIYCALLHLCHSYFVIVFMCIWRYYPENTWEIHPTFGKCKITLHSLLNITPRSKWPHYI